MSCGYNGSVGMFVDKFHNLGVYFFFNQPIILEEAGMHFTAFAARVANFLEVEILQPVLYVRWSSKGDDDFVFGSLVPDVAGRDC